MAHARLKKSIAIIFESERGEWSGAISKITDSHFLSDEEARTVKILLYLNFRKSINRKLLSKVHLISWNEQDSYYGFAPNRIFSVGDPNAYALFELNADTQRNKITLINMATGEMRQKDLVK